MKTCILVVLGFLLGVCSLQAPTLNFCPQSDITAYELALLMPAVFARNGKGDEYLARALRLAPASKRHISTEPCP